MCEVIILEICLAKTTVSGLFFFFPCQALTYSSFSVMALQFPLRITHPPLEGVFNQGPLPPLVTELNGSRVTPKYASWGY